MTPRRRSGGHARYGVAVAGNTRNRGPRGPWHLMTSPSPRHHGTVRNWKPFTPGAVRSAVRLDTSQIIDRRTSRYTRPAAGRTRQRSGR